MQLRGQGRHREAMAQATLSSELYAFLQDLLELVPALLTRRTVRPHRQNRESPRTTCRRLLAPCTWHAYSVCTSSHCELSTVAAKRGTLRLRVATTSRAVWGGLVRDCACSIKAGAITDAVEPPVAGCSARLQARAHSHPARQRAAWLKPALRSTPPYLALPVPFRTGSGALLRRAALGRPLDPAS